MRRKINILLIFLSGIILFSCSDDYNDSELRKEIERLKNELSALPKQVSAVQTVVDALGKGEVITKIDALSDQEGYRITFNDGRSIEALNGKKPPVIGIKELDSVYYWTITTDGKADFLLDKDNHKVRVLGKDGKTSPLGIDEDGYWTVDKTRIKDSKGNMVKATGDSFFKEVKENENAVIFVLADGKTITISKITDTCLYFENTEGTEFFVVKPGDDKRLKIKFSNIDKMEIVTKPEGWRVNLHRPDKYVNVSVPANAKFGMYEIVLRGISDKGLVFMAIAKISVASGEGFTDPRGTFILNEGNMTAEDGSLIFISSGGYVFDNLYAATNGRELGNVTQDLFIKDGKMWIISQNGKVAATGTAFNNEGMLVVADVKTMSTVKVYDDVFKDEKGKYKLSWPTHIAVLNDENVFIIDSYGVSLFNGKTGELNLIKNTRGAAKNRMAVADNKVFVINSQKLMVFCANKKEIVHTIDMKAPISGILASKDGNLWVSTTGEPNKIIKVNSKTYNIIKENAITLGKLGSGITAKGDTLYYSNASTKIYRHIFHTGESKFMVDAKTMVQNANIVYNNIAVHPVTGDVYINTLKGFGWDFLINNISVFNFDGKTPELKANYEDHTHFPAGVFFIANFK